MCYTAAPPSAGQFCTYGILSVLHQCSHIMCGVEHRLVELCESGLQLILFGGPVVMCHSHSLSVDVHVVNAQSSGVETCLHHLAFGGEFFSHHGCSGHNASFALHDAL